MTATGFIPGLEMGALFHRDIVAPIIRSRFPSMKYAAALIGPGSEVLGFDNEISTDHDWRPRVFIFLDESDKKSFGADLETILAQETPNMFRGFSTRAQKKEDLRSQTVFSVDEFWQ